MAHYHEPSGGGVATGTVLGIILALVLALVLIFFVFGANLFGGEGAAPPREGPNITAPAPERPAPQVNPPAQQGR